MNDDFVRRSDVHKVFQPKYAPAINRTFAAMIDSVPAADVVERPRWIPVTERLPENEVNVLVVRRFLGVRDVPPSTYVEIAEYCYGDWIADSDEYKIARRRHTDPLYWMPLPEPPKETI